MDSSLFKNHYWGLNPLFDILKGPSDPTSPPVLTDEGRQALNIVEKALAAQTSSHCDYTREWGLYILPSKHTPTAVLFKIPLFIRYISLFPLLEDSHLILI